MRQFITHFFSVSILEVIVLILNYVLLICFTNWLSIDDFAYYSNFLSLNAVLFTVISFGMGSFVYQNVTKGNISRTSLISHLKARGVIAVLVSLVLLLDVGYETRLLGLSILAGLLLSLNLSPFFDVIGKSHIYSLVKVIILISVNLLLVFLWRIEAFNLSILISAFFVNSSLQVILSFLIIRKLVPRSTGEPVSINRILKASKLFAVVSIITVVIDYSVLFVFKNSLNSELVAGLYLLIKLSIGVKVIDSSVLRIVTEKIQSDISLYLLHKITMLRVLIVLVVVFTAIILKDLLFRHLEISIQNTLVLMMPIWIIYMLSYTFNHYGTKLYVKGRTLEYFRTAILKFTAIMIITMLARYFQILNVMIFIGSISVINILEGLIFLRKVRR